MIKSWTVGGGMVDSIQTYDVNGHDEHGNTVVVARFIGWNAEKFAKEYLVFQIENEEEAEDIAKIEARANEPTVPFDPTDAFEKVDAATVEKKTANKSAKKKPKK